jgi:hypothetical protein
MAETDSITVEQAEKFLADLDITKSDRQNALREVGLSNEIQNRLLQLADDAANGRGVSYDELYEEIQKIAESHGYPGGIPVPMTSHAGEGYHRLVLANRSPLKGITEYNEAHTQAEAEARFDGLSVRNSWERLGDETMLVLDTPKGPRAAILTHAASRLEKIMDALGCAHESRISAEAEWKAMASLQERVKPNQFRTYIVCGMFAEHSPRSKLTYIFRKSRPTVALTFKTQDGKARAIAALCFHPAGYWQGTHIGVMPPTDEVISALLTMRADERRFWAKSGQWQAWDPRAGL